MPAPTKISGRGNGRPVGTSRISRGINTGCACRTCKPSRSEQSRSNKLKRLAKRPETFANARQRLRKK